MVEKGLRVENEAFYVGGVPAETDVDDPKTVAERAD